MRGVLDDGETVVAILPFASIRKVGYGQLVFTAQRLFLFDSTRTGKTGELLRVVPVPDVELVALRTSRLGRQALVVRLPETGELTFDVGTREGPDLAVIGRLLTAG